MDETYFCYPRVAHGVIDGKEKRVEMYHLILLLYHAYIIFTFLVVTLSEN
jgi:hypothetical protein